MEDWYPYPVRASDPDVQSRPIYDPRGKLVGMEHMRIDEEGTVWIVIHDYETHTRVFRHIPGDR